MKQPNPRKEQARAMIMVLLTQAYESPDFMTKGRMLELTIVQRMRQLGFTQAETLSALMYLHKVGRVDVETDTRETKLMNQTMKSEWRHFSLSEASLDEHEGNTRYTRKKEPHTMITNQDGNIVIGDGNVVASYNTYSAIFNDLDSAVKKSNVLSDTQKQEATADIATIKAQLGKPKPNLDIIRAAWNGMVFLSTAEGVTQFYIRARQFIETLL